MSALATTPPTPILCLGCGATGTVARVTAHLQCRCGSTDLDLYTRSPEQQAHIAALRGTPGPSSTPEPVPFTQWMTGRVALNEGPQQTRRAPMGTEIPGWNEYAGPRPSPNGMNNGVGTPYVCPTCHGTGYDPQEGGVCRMCGGAKVITPNADEHQEVPAVARHDYPSTQTTVPFLGHRKSTSKKKTRRTTAPKTAKSSNSDALNSLVATIQRSNPGLSRAAALNVAQRTLHYAGSR